jgi:hypothetical protein
MGGIIDHRTDGHAVDPAEMYIKHGSKKTVSKTTKGGTFVLSGNIVLQAWSAWRISRKSIMLRLLNMLLPKACLIPLILSGGPHMSFRNEP